MIRIEKLAFTCMTCLLLSNAVTFTARDGRISKLEQVYLRGGQIKFIVLPESLKASSIFKKVQQLSRAKKEKELTGGRGGAGRGSAAGRGGKRAAGK